MNLLLAIQHALEPYTTHWYVQSFVTLLTPKSNPDISDVELDSGVVLQKGPNKGYKVAMYKDSKGKTEEFSALCPHLGCQLQVTTVHQ